MAEEPQYALKRKYEDQPTATEIDLEVATAKQRAQEVAARLLSVTGGGAPPLSFDPKRSKSDNGGPQSGFDSYDSKPQYSAGSYGGGSSKKIEIPNGRVGVLIGKGGETIKYLQMQSGAKIQVTRDMDADPNSTTRMVELMGTSEAVASAEKLINEVLAEAEAGASVGGGTRRMAAQSGGDEFSMQIPNNKVGLIIGKGGETIKSMQASTGARIQVIPLHLPPGDPSTERTLKIDGAPDQIEAAKLLVNQIITGENRLRGSGNSGGYTQQGYQSRPPSSWAPPVAPAQQPGYGYGQPGSYSGPAQYNMPQPPYSGYPPQQPGGYPANWDQSTAPPHQQSASGYDYYNQQPQQQQNPGGPAQPADGSAYNYSQPPSTGYSQPGQGGYGQESYGAYNAPQQSGYGQPPTYDQQQGYGSAPSYGSGSNPTQEGHTSNYGSQADSSQTSQPSTVATQGYATNQQGTPQPGYGVAPTSQTAYGNQPQSGYGPGYGAPPSQKPTANPPVYGQSQSPGTAGSYGQSAYPPTQAPPSGYAQPESGTQRPPVQPGYGSQSYGAPQGGQPGYGQTPPSYGNSSYGAGYTQPPVYASDGAAAQPVQQGGVAKASPKS
ncbi:uncharacterized protein LOC131660779 [Vicia villosa]|uniref:uncharacterized protein LOC131660779 n=1 Tax=Vicia villosa TaxID=3911 RepID=UPI00273C7AB5|nr:uncharacterized protein LOC131660779 [Vicia villosa]